jgi:hypothetical protein
MNEVKDETTTDAGYLRMATIHLNLHYSSHRLKPASPIKKKSSFQQAAPFIFGKTYLQQIGTSNKYVLKMTTILLRGL